LRRYGVVCRAVLARETLMPAWRDLLGVFRRLEARGEIRGGRFVAPLSGEQFALPEALDCLRRVRREQDTTWIAISAADPLNLAGLSGNAGSRIPAVPTRQLVFRGGAAIAARSAAGIDWLSDVSSQDRMRVAELIETERRARPRLAQRR
jgi:ATP-dependent Lhr-like helicase